MSESHTPLTDAFHAKKCVKDEEYRDFARSLELIANTVPELLEALQHSLDVMEIHKVGVGCRTQNAARAAIAKATQS